MTGTTLSVDLEPVFDDIASFVDQSRSTVMRTANITLINLYWDIGQYLSIRCTSEGWGKGTVAALARLIHDRRPDWRGFSVQNLWRMKQFFEIYVGKPKLSTLLRELPWSANLHIVSKCKSDEERLFYLQRATQEHWSVREIAREMVEDLMAIVHTFSCRLYGMRKYKQTIKDDFPSVKLDQKVELQ